ncbi:MAG: Hsp20/alpha crystallin family protein [Syntrophobacterales bacterium]|nr:Hsp20/alpha crystallin family protein [Syntrophobacterales bacterium]
MIKNWLPSVWRRSESPLQAETEHPFHALQREMGRVFDDFSRSFDLTPFGSERGRDVFYPSVDVTEGDKEVTVKAELPGMEEKDIDVSLTDNSLTIRGEKREEREDKGKDYWHKETSYGSFSRVIPLPEGIDTEKVDARFKNGVLTVTMPKLETTITKSRKISIKAE